jgi:DNA repair photolyase
MPVLPGITDNPSDLEALVKTVSEAGATYVGACALRLRATARNRYLPFIAQEFPHLEERYRNTYAASYNAGAKYREGLAQFFDRICAKYHVDSWSRMESDDDEGDEALARLTPSEQLEFTGL